MFHSSKNGSNYNCLEGERIKAGAVKGDLRRAAWHGEGGSKYW